MQKGRLLFSLLVVYSVQLVHSFRNLPEFYHTTTDIKEAFEESCGEIQITNTEIPAVIIEPRSFKAVYKVFLIFGEHPRELISSELGLKMLSQICDLYDKRELRYTFFIIGNANPKSRIEVEKGDFCLRTNENGVDLNRNWDIYWEQLEDCPEGSECYPGDKAFSESETRQIKDWVARFKPDIFITIHSGKLDLGMPHAYNEETAERNAQTMMEVLAFINDKFEFNCDSGPIGADLGYTCPGNCMDFVYDKLKVPYSFAVEVWGPEAEGRFKSFLQSRKTKDHCLKKFNPLKKEEYEWTVNTWSNALLELVKKIEDIDSDS